MRTVLILYGALTGMILTPVFMVGCAVQMTRKTWRWAVLFGLLGFGEMLAMLVTASQL